MKTLTKGKPIKVILLFALPLFIGQLFNLFYSLADTRIVGCMLGEDALAAVGSVSTLSDMLNSMMNGFANGCAIVIATFFGARREEDMKKAVAGTALLSIGASLCISVLFLVFLNPVLTFLNIDVGIRVHAAAYIRILLGGLIASTAYNTCASVLRALGDSFTPLLFLILASFLNISLDCLFIGPLHMGVGGAAAATVFSQAVSALLCFFYMQKRYPVLRLCAADFRADKSLVQRLLSTGASMSFMVSFVNLGTVALQTAINTFGNNTIVAHTAARKLSSVFMLPFGVLGTTLATYCGQNLGAGRYGRIKKGIDDTLRLTFLWCAGVILVANTVAPLLVRAITATEDAEILETAGLYLKVNTAFYFVPAVICLLRNSMQGFGDSKTPVFSSSLELIGKVLVAFFLAPAIGYAGIMLAEPIVWFIMIIPLLIRILRSPVLKHEDADSSPDASL